jgi:quinol monooxygenase YgiN
MTKQVQCTGELTIVDGKIDAFKRFIPSCIEAVQKKEPDMHAFQVYLNADETKAYLVEWYKNSEAVLAHWVNVEPMLPELMAIARYTRLEVFGNVTQEVEDAMKSIGAPI